MWISWATGICALSTRSRDGIVLTEASRDATLRHIRRLWGYDVSLAGVDAETGATVYEHSTGQIGE